MDEFTHRDLGDQIPRRGNFLTLFLGRFLFWLLRWRIVGDLPNVRKSVFLCAPHTSNMDGIMVALTVLKLRINVQVMAKDSLFKPPFGGILKWLGGLPIDRSAANGVVGASVEEYNQQDQLWLGIAAEGTRHGADSWKKGFYHIALKAGVPITLAIMDYKTRQIRFPAAIEPSGDWDVDLEKILQHFKGVEGKYREKMSKPLKELNGWD